MELESWYDYLDMLVMRDEEIAPSSDAMAKQ